MVSYENPIMVSYEKPIIVSYEKPIKFGQNWCAFENIILAYPLKGIKVER